MKMQKKIRPVLQMEVTECGAASLAMILGYYGKTVTLEQLRQECCVSLNGVSVKSIARAAALHNLKIRALRTNISGTKQLRLPVILHWNMDHFLVLCGFKKKGVVLADPAYGMRTVSWEEFSDSFTGIALEFTPDENFEKDRGSIRERSFISSCLSPFMPLAFIFLLMEGCAWIAGFVLLFLNSAFIDSILNQQNTQNISIIWTFLLYAGLITLCVIALNADIRHKAGKLLNIEINLKFMEHIIKLPIEFFSMRSGGDLSNRQSANMLMGHRISIMYSPIPGYILQIILYLMLIFLLNVHIAFISVLCATASIICLTAGSHVYEDNMRAYSKNMGTLQGEVSRVIDGIETIKSCGAEDAATINLISNGCDALNLRTKMESTRNIMEVLISFFQSLGVGIILAAGAAEIISGYVTEGILVALQALTAAMLDPVRNVVNTGIKMYELQGEMARTDDVMHYHTEDKFLSEELPEITKNTKDIITETTEPESELELENVSFSYFPTEAPIIHDLSIKVKKGGSLAITGGSGSGKSTVAKIIAGLYRESSGYVRYNGLLRSQIHRSAFYGKTAIVSQNIRLFEGTVLDNITMWDNSISYDDAVTAAKAACIHEDIIRRSGGYRETVTENGKNFSGGQRQRIELARALAKKPSLLILDEATSSLDTNTEEQVMNNIKGLGITCVIVAHRLSTIRDCDEIIVLANGIIAERGTHEELIRKQGAYLKLLRNAE